MISFSFSYFCSNPLPHLDRHLTRAASSSLTRTRPSRNGNGKNSWTRIPGLGRNRVTGLVWLTAGGSSSSGMSSAARCVTNLCRTCRPGWIIRGLWRATRMRKTLTGWKTCGRSAASVIRGRLRTTDRWRAGCAERCMSGSEGGIQKPASARRWVPTLHELVRTLPTQEAVRRTRRTLSAVKARRRRLGVPDGRRRS